MPKSLERSVRTEPKPNVQVVLKLKFGSTNICI